MRPTLAAAARWRQAPIDDPDGVLLRLGNGNVGRVGHRRGARGPGRGVEAGSRGSGDRDSRGNVIGILHAAHSLHSCIPQSFEHTLFVLITLRKS